MGRGMSANTAEIVDGLRDAAAYLRRPFAVKALKWKVQAQWPKDKEPTGGLVVSYIDRGLVVDRLNVIVPHLWRTDFTELERGHCECTLTVDGVPRSDVGEGATPKARRSDALKRAAVHFGVGVSLSRIPQSRLTVAAGQLKAFSKQGGFGLEITQGGLNYLRERYAAWLDQIGTATFGDPLEHGDLEEAQGDEEATDGPVAAADEAAAVLGLLTGGDFTLRQQLGFLRSAGIALPATVTARDIGQIVQAFSSDQIMILAETIDRAKAKTEAPA